MATLSRCSTCWRMRPGPEFDVPVSDTLIQVVPICRGCRVKLWDDPDSAEEAR